MEARDKAAALYPFNGADPNIVTELRSAFRAGAEWQQETIMAARRASSHPSAGWTPDEHTTIAAAPSKAPNHTDGSTR